MIKIIFDFLTLILFLSLPKFTLLKLIRPLQKIWKFYSDGFRNMPLWGRQAWAVVIFKGIVVFIIMKFVFFPNYLKKNFDTNEQRSEHVLEQLTKTK